MSHYSTLDSQRSFVLHDIIDDGDVMIQPDNDNGNISEHQRAQVTLPRTQKSQQSGASSSSGKRAKKTYKGGCFTLNYYRKYFDLTTDEFFRNIHESINPIIVLKSEEFNDVGDLYGSIWLTSTLIFLLFFCNSFSELLGEWFTESVQASPPINYFKLILTSINLLYGYTITIPTLIYISLRFYFKILTPIPVSKLISIYSYSNILWIPACLLSIFRGLLMNHHLLSVMLKWICILIGFLLSGFSILFKFYQYLNVVFVIADDQTKKYGILLVLFLCHLSFSIGVKVCFFGDL